jgi:MscS family membrane protein
MTIENLTRRDKILITSRLAIRQDISPERFARLLEAIRSMLREHPQIESDSVRVRWIDIAESAFTVEVFCYALTVSAPQFYEIREDCLMKILNIVYAVGAALAYPSRTVYTVSSERESENAAINESNHSPQSNNEKALRHGV